MFSMQILQNMVITGAEDGSVHLLSSDGSGKRVETGSKCKIRMIRASSTADQFWVCTGAGELLLMDVEGKIIMRRMVHQESCNAVIELNEDFILSGGKDAHIQVISRKTLETESRIPAHNWAVYDFARSPDGTYLASGSRDKTVKIWRASDLSFVQRLSKENAEGHHYSVNRLLWDPASGILCSAGDDRNLYLWQQD
jgi:WD40 repeat protein